MAAKQFKFVSPGVFVNEIDNSQIPKQSDKIGPCVIGRLPRGPSMKPVKVKSFSEFVEIFGNPEPGGAGGDVWRDGNHKLAPTYAAYAAQAYLKNSSPVTVIRLLGSQHSNATTNGEAGWLTKDSSGTATGIGTVDANGGAYGLFLVDSGSTDILPGVNTNPPTGTLAAVWYFNQGSITLTGSTRSNDTTTTLSGTAVLIKSIGPDHELRAQIKDSSGNTIKTTTFNFNINSPKYIRRVFNTNPTLTNTSITQTAATQSYWLGSTFERSITEFVSGGAGSSYGIILGLKGDAGTKEGSDFTFTSQAAQTGWFIGQHLTNVSGTANTFQPEIDAQKLFRFHCHDTGEWTQRNIKISIQDIKASTNPEDPYGTFSVVLRRAQDSDNAVQVIERFSLCNLNPYSPNYIAKKIGDRYMTWDDTERRYREYGNYPNQSKFVRLEMDLDVDAGAVAAEVLPFGVYGPVRPAGFALVGGADQFQSYGTSTDSSDVTTLFVQGGSSIVRSAATGSDIVHVGSASGPDHSYTASFLFPAPQLRVSASDGNTANPKLAYWGLHVGISQNSTRFDKSYVDMVRPLPVGYNSFTPSSGETQHAWVFTLDDLSGSGIEAVYASGSRASGTSLTATSSANYKEVLNQGFDRFTSPLWGGFDGVDITQKEPFNNTVLAGGTQETNYAFNTVKRAIDTVSDPEEVEMNILSMPGLTHEGLTAHLLNVCEDRGDTLGIIDLNGGFVPSTENNNGDTSVSNRGDVDTTITNLNARGLNTSYGCAYYPWVQVRDTVNGASLWVPPSVAALGAMAYAERTSELFFAPAGFTRGGLTNGAAGIPVTAVRERLNSKQRDKLYEANVNPIAQFPSEGIVIYGQKTLQVTQSAVDRINVRRLMIFIKKEISRMAATILFDNNVRATWNRFLSKVDPFLRSIKTRLGLTDYRVILDETTTTPDLIDRNILYAKIFIKPARAIEFIALDFVIQPTGASFED